MLHWLYRQCVVFVHAYLLSSTAVGRLESHLIGARLGLSFAAIDAPVETRQPPALQARWPKMKSPATRGFVASTPWLRRIFAAARRHGALVIVDDVQAGCGRSGGFFSFDGLDLVPDLIVLSKSLSGFGLPFSLLLVAPEHDQWRPGQHNGTFRGNNHAMLTASVALHKFWADDTFATQAAARGQRVTEALTRIAAQVPGARVKGRGMFMGVDVGTTQLAASARANAFKHGLVIESAGPNDEVLKVMAPLTTPDALLDEGLDILAQAVLHAYAGTQRLKLSRVA